MKTDQTSPRTAAVDRRRLVALAATFGLASTFPRPLFAESWPTRPVRIIVPFAPGGSTDIVARITAERLSDIWGKQAVIENRPGGGTNIASEYVAHAEPDGYTMLMGATSLTTSRNLYRGLRYELSELAPVTLVCTFPILILVPNVSPAKTIGEFIALARRNGGKVTYGSPGVGTAPHLAGELLKQMAGFEMTHVPYRGDAPALTDTIAGRLDLQIGGTAMLEQVRSGQVRALAVTTGKRSPAAPDVPTVSETGVPGFDVSGWFALFVPAKTSQEIVRKMHVDTAAVLGDPVLRAKFERIGMVAAGSTPEELGAWVASETEKWGRVIRQAGITLDQ